MWHPASVIFILSSTISGLSDIFPSGPDKIAQDSFILLCNLPEATCILAESLCTEDQTFRIFFQVMFVSEKSVVVTSDIHICKSIFCFPVTWRKCRTNFHKIVANQTGKCIIEFTSYRFFLFFFLFFCLLLCNLRTFFCFIIAVDTHSHGA